MGWVADFMFGDRPQDVEEIEPLIEDQGHVHVFDEEFLREISRYQSEETTVDLILTDWDQEAVDVLFAEMGRQQQPHPAPRIEILEDGFLFDDIILDPYQQPVNTYWDNPSHLRYDPKHGF